MNEQEYIKLDIICTNYHINRDLVLEFYDFGFVEIHTIEPDEYLHNKDIAKLEQVLNFYRELDINLPGIEVIMELLQKLDDLQSELNSAKRQLEIHRRNYSE